MGDLERLTGRAAHGHASPRELGALRRSLEALPAVALSLESAESLALRDLAGHVAEEGDLAAYLAGALVLGAAFVVQAVQFSRHLERRRARLLFASILYLPLLLGLMVADKIRY